LVLFIFDSNIINELPEDDARISFIHLKLFEINSELIKEGSSLLIRNGDPEEIWKDLIRSHDINEVYINKDYEPYAIVRDEKIDSLLRSAEIKLKRFKDQVIFEEREILKSDGTPYTVFTPYKKKWLQKLNSDLPEASNTWNYNEMNFLKCEYIFPSLQDLGFIGSNIKVRSYDLSVINNYHKDRDFPARDKTSYLSPHLRFGTVSIRKIVIEAMENPVFLSELIWREFFMQILFHFPRTVTENFRTKYDDIQWVNNPADFQKWTNGETGYPIVDAGMRHLNKTGFMHNRVRMITAGFLCKHLLIDWRWGEAYFAQKLLDYELSSNVGNWQWAAGTGCDAAPYFRVFNPESQQKKFDPEKEYIRKWIDDFNTKTYPEKIVEHDFARQRAIFTYKSGLKKLKSVLKFQFS
jgi:deoxyribodipyrimidine photo-lyase